MLSIWHMSMEYLSEMPAAQVYRSVHELKIIELLFEILRSTASKRDSNYNDDKIFCGLLHYSFYHGRFFYALLSYF